MISAVDSAAATVSAHTAGTHGMVQTVIVELLVVFAAAKLVGYIFSRFRQPVVIGELLTGILMGPYIFNILRLNDPALNLTFEVLAEVAVVLLLFSIGLETKLSDLVKVGMRSLWVALGGVILPFILGYLYLILTGGTNVVAMFMGAIMVATSVGITARILKDLHFLSHETSRIILGAAVIDDVLGLIVLSVVSGVADKGYVSFGAVSATLLVIIVFILFFTLGGVHVTKKYGYQIGNLKLRNAPLIAGAIVCFTYSVVAAQIGLAAIVGAFMAGMVMAEKETEFEVKEKIEIVNEILVVFFFVIMGAKVNIYAFTDWGVLLTGVVITLLAFMGKYIGCGLPVLKMGFKKASFIGLGMAPRGEVGIIIAAYALSRGIIDDRLYGVAIFMVLVTTLVPPFILEPMIRSIKNNEKKADEIK